MKIMEAIQLQKKIFQLVFWLLMHLQHVWDKSMCVHKGFRLRMEKAI